MSHKCDIIKTDRGIRQPSNNYEVDNMLNLESLIESGKALHGANWVTPLARDLNINRKTIQRYVNGELKQLGKFDADLASLLYVRNRKIEKLLLILDEAHSAKDARNKAIREFKRGGASHLTPQSKVYCRLRFNQNGYYRADIQVNEPDNKSGWQCHEFDNKYFMRDVVNLDETLGQKLQDHMAVFDGNLNGEHSLELSLLD